MIRFLIDKGWSQRKVARELGINRKTIKRYLTKNEMPAYHRCVSYPSILDPHKKYIQERLDNYPDLTAEKIYRELKKKGFTGSYRITAYFVNKIRPQIEPEAFLRYETKPGVWAQVDWGDFGDIDYYGRKTKLFCFSMVLGYSRAQYIEFTVASDEPALQRCHVHAFEYFGGVPEKILYDNMKTVVLFHIGDEVGFNKEFLDFARHYGFIPQVCEVNTPTQKGKVERTIGYIRTSFFAGEAFASLDELNGKAWHWLDKVCNIRIHKTTGAVPFERLKEERGFLKQLPATAYRICRVEYRSVHKDSYLCFEGNCYSVPYQYAKKRVMVEVYEKAISVYCDNRQIATHVICPFRGRYIRDNAHFEGLIHRPKNKLKSYEDLFVGYGELGKEFVRALVKSGLSNPHYHLIRIVELMAKTPAAIMKFALERAYKYRAYDYKTIRRIIEQLPEADLGSVTVKLDLVLCRRCQYEDVEVRPLEYYEAIIADQAE